MGSRGIDGGVGNLSIDGKVAPLLLFGVYNNIVKTQGSDRAH
jgi:hypothetical protein